ncbi:hypothetical protein ACUVHH_14565 [Vibrio parahaemolyticus]|uniref:hypothetical protein n=1 Tax=Vibrio parahaemolyticus TaxID=670 RepID=UPI00405755B1
MKKYLLVTAILDLEFESKLSSPIKIQENVYVTNNPEHYKKFIKPEHFMAIGSLEGNLLYKGVPVVYQECLVADIAGSHVALVDFMRNVLAFLMATWMERDNSANIELGFAISQSDNHVHSNSLTYYYCQSDTSNCSTTITNTELHASASTSLSKIGGMASEQDPQLTMSQKTVGRQNVASSFLQQARSSADIGVKVANYCSFFEALLSTNSAELSHQLAERAAFLLRDTPEERYEHFKKTKKAYGVRSKVVHGDVLSTSQLNAAKETSAHCDLVARELMKKLISDDDFLAAIQNKDNAVLDNYLIKKIFGVV